MKLFLLLSCIGAAALVCTDAFSQASRSRRATPSPSAKPGKTTQNNKKQITKKGGVRSQFRSAQKLYNERQYDRALLAYDRILRKYPSHQPSIVQMAKVLYRLDRIPEAYRFFARINPVSLDIDTSYEYALSHFWMRQYQQSLYGFQRIPKGHALFDLANYYGGISALKLRRLDEAETMMENAVVLPTKLARSRKNYLKHIQELKLIYEKRGLAEERSRERKRIEARIQKEQPIKLAPQEHPNIKEDEGYKHKGFEKVKVAPEIGYLFKNQQLKFHGFAEEDTTLQISYFQFKGGPLIPLPIKVNDDQAAIGVQLKLRAESLEKDGIERRNIQTDDTEDIQRILTTDPEKSHSKFGTATINPWLEFPTGVRVWIALGGELFLRYPDFERTDLSSSRAGYLRIGSKEEHRRFSLKYKYAEIADADDQLLQSIHTTELDWLFSITEDVTLELELKHDFFTYEDLSIDGPTSGTSFSGDIYDELPFGFILGLTGSALYQSQYLVHDLPTYGDVDADGQTLTGELYLEASPVDWFTLTASTVVQKSYWQVNPEAAQETYEKNNADVQQEFIAEAALNLLF